MDLSMLQALERERVLEVLHRDKLLRSAEEERIRRLKSELQEIRRKGAKSFSRQYSERTCARCQRPLGKFWNSGSVCRGCSHRICSKCRVGVSTVDWKCTVCYAYREVKIMSGEWFLEERAKKYPAEPDRHETVGEKLLKSYQLSHISVVPPTPPPFNTDPFVKELGALKNSKPFTKSVEDLVVSFTSRIKNISKSHNDVRGDQDLLTVDRTLKHRRLSASDTDINSPTNLAKGCNLSNLFKKGKDSDQEAEDFMELGYAGQKRGSNTSTSTECCLFERMCVTGELELAIAFNSSTSCLEVTVGACRNLTFGDVKRRKCHPYVKIYLLPEKSQISKQKTSVKRNSTDPVYNEVLECQLDRPLLAERTLQASVWHAGTLKRKVFLGEVLIPLEGWRFEDRSTRRSAWYTLCPKPECPAGVALGKDLGELRVRIKFSSLSQPSWISHTNEVHIGPHENGQLTVLVSSARGLPTRANISQNAYVKGSLTLPRSRELVQKTPVLKKSCPEWSHQLVFSRVTPSDLLDSTLDMDLWDHASFGLADRPLGRARIETGLLWQLVMQMPNMWHDFSLPVRANDITERA